jgi:predicted dehydrogenase
MYGPNDTIRGACVGICGRGTAHIRAVSKVRGVEIAALCDVDESVLNERV